MKKARLSPSTIKALIGPNAALKIGKRVTGLNSKRAFIVADEKLIDHRKTLGQSLLSAGWEVNEIAVQAGESLKDFKAIQTIYAELLNKKADRDSVLFALGGGTVGDAAGFVASTYLRGIQWVGVPTTLLAQVDSAIGGKTAVNHPLGKNMIGTFHQPSAVVCDTEFLKTLTDREFVSGFGEIIKYGIVFDPKFYSYLVKNTERFFARDPAVLKHCIERSIYWKTKIVAKDEFDRKGFREVLNFGHTFAHALESVTGYQTFQHGEAVIWGMRFALALSQVRKKLSIKQRQAIDLPLKALTVPNIPSQISLSTLLKHMTKDKKVRNGQINFVLITSIGKAVSDGTVTEQDLANAYQLLALGKG